MISSGSGLSIYDRRRDKSRRMVIKVARTSIIRNKVVKTREKSVKGLGELIWQYGACGTPLNELNEHYRFTI